MLNQKNSNNLLLNLSAGKFDLISKAVKGFACKEIRIENSTLILENTGKSVAYVQLDEFLDGKTDVNFCVNMPKNRLDVICAAKTNAEVRILDIDSTQVSIQFGNFTAVLEKRNSNSNPVLRSVQLYREITEARDIKLYRNLFASMCRPKGVSLYVHATEERIVSVGTGVDSLDLTPECSGWVEGRDIVINCNLSLRCDNRNINIRVVKVEEKHHLLLSYTLTDNFVVKHFFKAN